MHGMRREDQAAGGMEGGSGSSAGSSQHYCPSAGMAGSASLSPAQFPDDCNNRGITAISVKWDSSPDSCCGEEGRKKTGMEVLEGGPTSQSERNRIPSGKRPYRRKEGIEIERILTTATS